MDTRLVAGREFIDSTDMVASLRQAPPAWINRSPLLVDAYSLAVAAHGEQRRPSDGRYFLDHVVEVAELLQRAGFDDELVAVGLLHDSVERGTLSEEELRDEMGESISSLVLVLSEDPGIESFERRKAGLRDQVAAAGGLGGDGLLPPTSSPTFSGCAEVSRRPARESRSASAPASRA